MIYEQIYFRRSRIVGLVRSPGKTVLEQSRRRFESCLLRIVRYFDLALVAINLNRFIQ